MISIVYVCLYNLILLIVSNNNTNNTNNTNDDIAI